MPQTKEDRIKKLINKINAQVEQLKTIEEAMLNMEESHRETRKYISELLWNLKCLDQSNPTLEIYGEYLNKIKIKKRVD